MARTEFDRRDATITIRQVHDAVVLRAGHGVVAVPPGQLQAGAAAIAKQLPRPDLGGVGDRDIALPRLVLDIDARLHAHPWEAWMRAIARDRGYFACMRTSRVIPRVRQAEFTVPLRVLLIDHGEPGALLEDIRSLFGERTLAELSNAIVAGWALHHFTEMVRPIQNWPVVDVVHFGALPLRGDAERQLSPSRKQKGTMGWIAQLLDQWETRLLILDADDEAEAALARRLAASLVARAGPAAIVRRTQTPARPLYAQLVHDFPLDALDVPLGFGHVLPDIDSLFAGAGREDLVRVSNAGEAIVKRTEWRRFGPDAQLLSVDTRLREAAADFSKQYEDYSFGMHESDGYLPMSESLDAVRMAAAACTPEPERITPRYVNGSLRHENDQPVDAVRERLLVGAPYQFRMQIGERDREVPVYGSSCFQEVPKVMPEQEGVWVDVAVSGVGIEVEGDPVQELWVPYDAPSEAVHFAIRAAAPGAVVLRYTLYHEQNVLQTFRIAALATNDGQRQYGGPEQDERDALAAALAVPPGQMPWSTWIARLEYAAQPITAAHLLPGRALSIVANDVAGERVVTVKGEEFFVRKAAGDLKDRVSDVRDALLSASLDMTPPRRDDWLYRFGATAEKNDAAFRSALPQLALAGWRLYNRVLPYDQREKIEVALGGEGKTINIAHVLLEEVIPWASIYDRMFALQDGESAQVCDVAMPDANGRFAASECKAHAQCLLHTVDEKRVACPLRFWGFRHIIEVPPRQVVGSDAPAEPIAAGEKARDPQLCAALNTTLTTAEPHMERLAKLGKWKRVERDPAQVTSALEDLDLDVIYLFCHARGGAADPAVRPPLVEFSDKVRVVKLTDDQFDFAPWKNLPLVIVNGCSTAAFSPDALSPFVRKFAEDRKAGGVLGTEMPVHEVLAADVAEGFLARFLNGAAAGPALLAVRRALLANKNPLGLAYTLYAPADLKL
ncbi:MAG TPA: hypothetical protein VF432_04035 [Thermoanaerobaculia bacterium]